MSASALPSPQVFVCLPAFGNVNTSFTTASLVSLTRALTERGMFYGFAQKSFPDICDLRAIFLTIWFDGTSASHLLFVDDDMEFEPQLVLDMLEFDHPLVGAVYPKRTLPLTWAAGRTEGEQIVRNGFLRIDGMGMGCALIRRDCVQSIIDQGLCEIDTDLESSAAGRFLKGLGHKRMIRAFEKIELPGRRLSEDISFCRRHQDAGGDVWGAIHHPITHVGLYGYTGRFADYIDSGEMELVK